MPEFVNKAESILLTDKWLYIMAVYSQELIFLLLVANSYLINTLK